MLKVHATSFASRGHHEDPVPLSSMSARPMSAVSVQVMSPSGSWMQDSPSPTAMKRAKPRPSSWSAPRACVARPSIIVGESDTGSIGRFEKLYGFLRLIGAGRITLLPSTPDASLDLVPIDHVIGGLIDIIENFELATGKTFHLVSGDPAPLAALTALDYSGFHVPRLVSAERFDLSHLSPAERALYRRVTCAYATYLRRNPRFAAQNLAALSGRV